MKYFRYFSLTTVLFIAILGYLPEASARAKTPPSPPEWQQRLDDLEQKQKVLERNLELKEEQLQEKEKEKPKIKASADGISISSADGNNEIRFKGLIQADARFYLERDGVGPVHTFIARRVRPWIEGKFAKRFEFRIMPDFGDGKVVLQDAYINSVIFPEFKIQVGKFKEPVGLERLEGAPFIHFVERGFPTQIAPNRDLGVMANGEFLDGTIQYQLGIFNGIFDGGSADFDFNNGKDFAGRIFFHPFKKTSIEAGKGLGLGVSGTLGVQNGNTANPNLPSYKTAGQRTFFTYRNDGTAAGTAEADGGRWRVSPQLYYYYKGFGLLGEYIISSQNVLIGANTADIKAQAWQVAASYVIGADNSFGKIKPRKPLGWKKGGTGAFEFAARYNELKVDPNAFPIFADPNKSAQKAKAFGVGFNWHINENVKFMLDFEHTKFTGGGPGGDNQKAENVILNRYQMYF